jgi:hypothetical protein
MADVTFAWINRARRYDKKLSELTKRIYRLEKAIQVEEES